MAHEFCLELYRETMAEVRQRFTRDQIKKVWVWSSNRKDWEFHGPNGEYIYNLKMADCSWGAKAEGWAKLLERLDSKEVWKESQLNHPKTKVCGAH